MVKDRWPRWLILREVYHHSDSFRRLCRTVNSRFNSRCVFTQNNPAARTKQLRTLYDEERHHKLKLVCLKQNWITPLP